MSVWHHHWSGRLYVVVLGSYKHPRMAQRNFLLPKNSFAPRMPSGLIVICCLYTLNVYFDKLFVICTGALMAATFEKLDTFSDHCCPHSDRKIGSISPVIYTEQDNQQSVHSKNLIVTSGTPVDTPLLFRSHIGTAAVLILNYCTMGHNDASFFPSMAGTLLGRFLQFSSETWQSFVPHRIWGV